jgi:hypothetical protein
MIAGSIPPEGDDYYDYHPRSKTRDDDYYDYHPRSKTRDDSDYYNYRPHPKTHGDDYDYRSSSKTPVINVIDDNSRHTGRGKADDSRHENQPLENLLIKQGKQIRALYELQKKTFEKVTWVQNQIKKQNNTNKLDLSPKVFNVSKFH